MSFRKVNWKRLSSRKAKLVGWKFHNLGRIQKHHQCDACNGIKESRNLIPRQKSELRKKFLSLLIWRMDIKILCCAGDLLVYSLGAVTLCHARVNGGRLQNLGTCSDSCKGPLETTCHIVRVPYLQHCLPPLHPGAGATQKTWRARAMRSKTGAEASGAKPLRETFLKWLA